MCLEDQSRAPKSTPHRTWPELVKLVLAERKRHPTWGPRKLKASLEGRGGGALPSASTIGEVLLKAGVVERRKTRGWALTLRYRNCPVRMAGATASASPTTC